MIHFDSNYFRLVEETPNFFVVTYKSKEPDDKEFDEYITALDKMYTNDEKIIVLQDAQKAANYLASAHRIKLGNYMKNNKEKMANGCIATALLTKSLLHKMLMKAIFAIQPMPMPHAVFNDYEAAEAWLQEQLEQATA